MNTRYLIGCGVVVLVICVVAVCIGLALSSSEPQTVDEYMKQYGGNPDVYQDLLTSNDCDHLQEQFNQADSNLALHSPGTQQYEWGLGYMKASDARMKEIGCYDNSTISPNTPQSSNPTVALIQAQVSSTAFILPTLTQPATSTLNVPTVGPAPTLIYVFPTNTRASGGGTSGICPCSGDTLNCTEDFSTQAQAQACFIYCVAQGAGDIHRLDGNNDGVACESLP